MVGHPAEGCGLREARMWDLTSRYTVSVDVKIISGEACRYSFSANGLRGGPSLQMVWKLRQDRCQRLAPLTRLPALSSPECYSTEAASYPI